MMRRVGEEGEEVDDDEDDQVSFASRTVYLENFLKNWKMLRRSAYTKVSKIARV